MNTNAIMKTNSRMRTASRIKMTEDTCYMLVAIYYLLPFTCYMLLATCYLLPVTCHYMLLIVIRYLLSDSFHKILVFWSLLFLVKKLLLFAPVVRLALVELLKQLKRVLGLVKNDTKIWLCTTTATHHHKLNVSIISALTYKILAKL